MLFSKMRSFLIVSPSDSQNKKNKGPGRTYTNSVCLSTKEKNNPHDELINPKRKKTRQTGLYTHQIFLGNCLVRNVNVEPLLIH